MPTAHQTAIDWATRFGWYVFPLREPTGDVRGDKLPIPGVSWKSLATNDPLEIELGEYAGHNWALDCGRSGVVVLDVDVKAGKDGRTALSALGETLPPTLTCRTASGGYHYIYTGTARNSASKIGDGLDIRGHGGYIVIPGSVAGGKPYAIESDFDPAPAPKWLLDLAGQPIERKPDQAQPLVELDMPSNVTRAAEYLRTAPPAVEGQGGDHQTFKTICRVRDYGVSRDECVQLLLDVYNPRCSPPWDYADLARKVANAYTYAKDRPGNAAPEALFPAVAPNVSRLLRCPADVDPADIPKRRRVLGYRYFLGHLTITASPGGVGKSSHAILEALSIASGTSLTGDEVLDPGPVVIVNEDSTNELNRRIYAAALHHKMPRTVLQNIRTISLREAKLMLATEAAGQVVINEPAVASLVKNIKTLGAKLLILDPLVNLHSLNENDNGAMAIFANGTAVRIADEAGCAVGIIHHTPKGAAGNYAGDINAFRGAGSLSGVARCGHTLIGMSEKDAKEYLVPAHRRGFYVRLDNAKANMGPPQTSTTWFEKVGVELPNGEIVGTLQLASLTRISSEDQDESLLQAAIALIPDDVPISTYKLAQDLHREGFDEGTAKTLQRRLETLFAGGQATQFGVFSLKKDTARNGMKTVAIVKEKTKGKRGKE